MEGDFRLDQGLVQPQLNTIVSPINMTVQLEPKVIEALVFLAGHAGEVFPKERILQALWAETFVTEEDTVSVLTQEGTTAGTLPYASPEQLRGETIDSRSDIFSLGIVLLEMIAGVHPFEKKSAVETAAAMLDAEPDSYRNPRRRRVRGLKCDRGEARPPGKASVVPAKKRPTGSPVGSGHSRTCRGADPEDLSLAICRWSFDDLILTGFNDKWQLTNEKRQILCTPALRLRHITVFTNSCTQAAARTVG